ncbi:hypothetical protein T01_7079 [Trichinella spiralis]|uniref:ATP synthase F(0) complex subunit e, mitochondrial n=2 Tax=Trichinella spiralis TaxID=6334 RepID=A0A0V1BZA1_TRISP|nr:hypothetical protein T01_7079 [Trichinella spiralis]
MCFICHNKLYFSCNNLEKVSIFIYCLISGHPEMPIVAEHPNRVILKPPLKVSPTIRAARYVMLGLGILYGVTRQKYLTIKHEHFVRKIGEEHLRRKIAEAQELQISGKKSLCEVGKELGLGYSVDWAGYKYEPIDMKKILK